MKIFEYLDRISMMHKLVSRQRTGTPEEFAKQLGVSRTSLYELIDEMRSRGAPISYSKSTKTFFYRQPYDIAVTCLLRPLTYNEEKENSGGIKLFSKVLFFRTLLSDLSMVSLPC
ncbi:MAG: HTH domain-containing protein [Bacteroidetes bacterium]|nr:MAG: HTH domain-containing protein [Bacteroidota bacterium]